MLHELFSVEQAVREGYNAFAFNRVWQAISAFTNSTVSTLYFSAVKETLYADAEDSPNRLEVMFVMQKVGSFIESSRVRPDSRWRQLYDAYVAMLAPIAPHLAEEMHYFAGRAQRDPERGQISKGSVFEKVWKPIVGLSLVSFARRR
jgi:isoleucyl-tRNA synthetase